MGMGPISSRCRSPWAFAPPGLGKIHLRWSQTRWTGNLWGWGWGGGWDAVVDAGDPWDVPMFYSEVGRIRHDHHQHHHFLWSSWSGDNHHHGLYLNYSVGSWFWIRDPRDPRRPYKESPKKTPWTLLHPVTHLISRPSLGYQQSEVCIICWTIDPEPRGGPRFLGVDQTPGRHGFIKVIKLNQETRVCFQTDFLKMACFHM